MSFTVNVEDIPFLRKAIDRARAEWPPEDDQVGKPIRTWEIETANHARRIRTMSGELLNTQTL